MLTEPCEFLVHGCVVNFCNPGLDFAEITVKAAVKAAVKATVKRQLRITVKGT